MLRPEKIQEESRIRLPTNMTFMSYPTGKNVENGSYFGGSRLTFFENTKFFKTGVRIAYRLINRLSMFD